MRSDTSAAFRDTSLMLCATTAVASTYSRVERSMALVLSSMLVVVFCAPLIKSDTWVTLASIAPTSRVISSVVFVLPASAHSLP